VRRPQSRGERKKKKNSSKKTPLIVRVANAGTAKGKKGRLLFTGIEGLCRSGKEISKASVEASSKISGSRGVTNGSGEARRPKKLSGG